MKLSVSRFPIFNVQKVGGASLDRVFNRSECRAIVGNKKNIYKSQMNEVKKGSK